MHKSHTHHGSHRRRRVTHGGLLIPAGRRRPWLERLEHRIASRARRINLRLVAILLAVGVLLAGGLAAGWHVRSRVLAGRDLRDGRAALERRDWVAACRHLKQYLARCPHDTEMLRRYAKAHLSVWPAKKENVGSAIGAYRQILRLQPTDADACARLTRLYLLVGNPVEAASVCRQRLAVDPTDESAVLGLGRAMVALHHYAEAIDWLGTHVKTHAGCTDAYVILSEAAIRKRPGVPLQEGLQWLDQAVESSSMSAEARIRRARFYRAVMKDDRAARTDLEVADALQPTDLESLLLLAEEWSKLGQLDRAEAKLAAAGRVDMQALLASDVNPDDLTLALFTARANLILRRGTNNQAAALADRALDELPGMVRPRFLPLAVELYLAGGKIADARQCLTEYREVIGGRSRDEQLLSQKTAVLEALLADADGKPYVVIDLLEGVLVTSSVGGQTITTAADAQVWKLLARSYAKTGQGRRALAALEKYCTRQPGDGEAYVELARAFLRSRDWQKALKYARDAERLRPGDLAARLVRVEASFRYVEEPVRTPTSTRSAELTALRESHPRDARIRILEARIALGQGSLDEAAALLVDAMSTCDDPVSIAAQLVEVRLRQGRQNDALQACRDAIARRPALAAPQLALADLLAAAGRRAEARETLDAALAQLAGEERHQVEEALPRRLLRLGDRAAGLAGLRTIAAQRAEDVASRLALLEQPEVQQDAAESQRLVDDLRRIEGERGLRWRLEQARVWLRAEAWRARSADIEALLTRCVDTDPGWAEAVVVFGDMHERLNKPDKAEQLYRRFTDANPGNPAVTMRLLELFERQKRFVAARKLLDRMPSRLSLLSGHRVKVAVGRGDYDEAIRELKKHIEANPGNAMARVFLARLLYYHTRDSAVAMRLLDEAAAIDPALPLILASRVSILHGEGRDDEVNRLLDRETAARGDFATYLLRAEFRAAAGRLDEAESDYTRLTALPAGAAEGYLELGRFHEKAGRQDRAIATWEAGLARYPQSAELKRRLIGSLLQDPEEAARRRGLALLEQSLASSPEDADLLSLRAAMLLRENTPASLVEAEAVLERVVQLHPWDVDAHLHLIDRARAAGDLQRAGALASRASGANPENVAILCVQAELHRGMNNLRTARELAEYVLEIDPRNVTARIQLGYLDLQEGRLDAADATSRDALRLEPANAEAQVMRALVLAARNQHREAIGILEQQGGHGEAGDRVRVLVTLADLHRLSGDFIRSRDCIEEASRLAPDEAGVFLTRLRWLASQRLYDEILIRYADRRARGAEEPAVSCAVASILAYAGADHFLREARAIFSRCTQAHPDNGEAWRGLAQTSYQLGDLDACERAYRKALALDPFDARTLNNLAWLLSEQRNKPADALELAGRGVLRHPTDPHLLDTRGTVLLRLNRAVEARRDLEKAAEMLRGQPAARARTLTGLARALALVGEPAKARSAMDEAFAIDRDHHVFTMSERTELRRLAFSPDADRNSRGEGIRRGSSVPSP